MHDCSSECVRDNWLSCYIYLEFRGRNFFLVGSNVTPVVFSPDSIMIFCQLICCSTEFGVSK